MLFYILLNMLCLLNVFVVFKYSLTIHFYFSPVCSWILSKEVIFFAWIGLIQIFQIIKISFRISILFKLNIFTISMPLINHLNFIPMMIVIINQLLNILIFNLIDKIIIPHIVIILSRLFLWILIGCATYHLRIHRIKNRGDIKRDVHEKLVIIILLSTLLL